MNYEDYTVNSKNWLARFAHRRRVSIGNALVDLESSPSVLDFGCGDGNFLRVLSNKSGSSKLIGYEPYMELSHLPPSVSVFQCWGDVEDWCSKYGRFDTVTCFEVLEHFSRERQAAAIDKILSLLKRDGTLIISVPIEKGLPVIPKNFRRIATIYKGSENIYTVRNIVCSMLGVKSKSLNEIRLGDHYLSHMGFYFTDLEDLLLDKFEICSRLYSPFQRLPYHFNSQVFYKLQPK